MASLPHTHETLPRHRRIATSSAAALGSTPTTAAAHRVRVDARLILPIVASLFPILRAQHRPPQRGGGGSGLGSGRATFFPIVLRWKWLYGCVPDSASATRKVRRGVNERRDAKGRDLGLASAARRTGARYSVGSILWSLRPDTHSITDTHSIRRLHNTTLRP